MITLLDKKIKMFNLNNLKNFEKNKSYNLYYKIFNNILY